MIKTNAKARLLTYLSNGNSISVAQARSRFKIANPRARIAELRADGVKIVTEMREGRDGVERAVYSLATAPSRSRVRA